jgi:hypothetical protein
MDSRLEEIRRKPMTPAQMVRFYGGTKDHRPSQKARFMAALGEALRACLKSRGASLCRPLRIGMRSYGKRLFRQPLITLGQRVKPENTVQTAKPAYQGKK